jgi:hypothetical protein
LIRSQSAEYFCVRFSSLHKHCRTGTPSLILPILAAHHSLFSADFITNIAESSVRHTHPIDSSIDTHQIQSVRRSSIRQERCAHTTKNRMEVLCPRVTQAAMIAAASFGLRRSGTFATATSGAAYWAASVRHGPPWPLPVNAPKSIFQNSILYRAASSVGSPPSCGEWLGWGVVSCGSRLVHTPIALNSWPA